MGLFFVLRDFGQSVPDLVDLRRAFVLVGPVGLRVVLAVFPGLRPGDSAARLVLKRVLLQALVFATQLYVLDLQAPVLVFEPQQLGVLDQLGTGPRLLLGFLGQDCEADLCEYPAGVGVGGGVGRGLLLHLLEQLPELGLELNAVLFSQLVLELADELLQGEQGVFFVEVLVLDLFRQFVVVLGALLHLADDLGQEVD